MRLAVPRSGQAMRRLLARVGADPVTYDGPSIATASAPPSGFRLDRHVSVIGHGDDDFARATDALCRWQTHGVRFVGVHPADADVAVGVTVVVTFGVGVLSLAAPCRVTDVSMAPDRASFCYRTVRGHPECGEERFEVRIDDNGDVTAHISAISRPDDAFVRALSPFARLVQRRVTAAYATSLRRSVARPTS